MTDTPRPTSRLTRVVETRIEDETAIDAVVPAFDRAVGSLGSGRARSLLRGVWLGHALHPVLTDAPLGCWMSANILDLLGGRRARPAAQRLVGIGVLAALPTAATGLSDFGEIDSERSRRVAAVHGIGNSLALVCFVRSWRRRQTGHHLGGAVWGFAGSAIAAGAGFLGGHLAFARSVGTGERTHADDDGAPRDPTSLPVG